MAHGMGGTLLKAARERGMGILCMKEIGSNFPKGQWLKVTGRIRYFEDEQDGQKVAVPCLDVEDYVLTSKPENEIIYFN